VFVLVQHESKIHFVMSAHQPNSDHERRPLLGNKPSDNPAHEVVDEEVMVYGGVNEAIERKYDIPDDADVVDEDVEPTPVPSPAVVEPVPEVVVDANVPKIKTRFRQRSRSKNNDNPVSLLGFFREVYFEWWIAIVVVYSSFVCHSS
jgi:hypothetical protein